MRLISGFRALFARADFRAQATRQTDGRDRPTSRLAPSSRPDSQGRPVSPETLGGETLVQGCAVKQYKPWLRPPKFAAPKALLIRVTNLSGGIPVHGCTQRRKTSGLRSTIRASYDSPGGLRPKCASNDTREPWRARALIHASCDCLDVLHVMRKQ